MLCFLHPAYFGSPAIWVCHCCHGVPLRTMVGLGYTPISYRGAPCRCRHRGGCKPKSNKTPVIRGLGRLWCSGAPLCAQQEERRWKITWGIRKTPPTGGLPPSPTRIYSLPIPIASTSSKCRLQHDYVRARSSLYPPPLRLERLGYSNRRRGSSLLTCLGRWYPSACTW